MAEKEKDKSNLSTAIVADAGLSISGHVHRLTKTGERVVRWLTTDGSVLCALTARRTKLVNRATLNNTELIEIVGLDDPRNRGASACLWHIRLQGRSLFFEGLTHGDAQLWVETLLRIREQAKRNAAMLPVNHSLRDMPLVPPPAVSGAQRSSFGKFSSDTEKSEDERPPNHIPPPAPPVPEYSVMRFLCACDLTPKVRSMPQICALESPSDRSSFVVPLQKSAPLPLTNGTALPAPDENVFCCDGEDMSKKGGAAVASINGSSRVSSSERESVTWDQSSPPLRPSAEGGSFEAIDEESAADAAHHAA
jgi:hypothetical protein